MLRLVLVFFILLGSVWLLIRLFHWLRNKPCIVISERLADVARTVGMRQIIVSQYDSIMTTLAEHYNKD